jgi:hypothetical protein
MHTSSSRVNPEQIFESEILCNNLQFTKILENYFNLKERENAPRKATSKIFTATAKNFQHNWHTFAPEQHVLTSS